MATALVCIDYVGCSKQHGYHVFGNIAVRKGVISEVNTEDFFEIDKLRLETLASSGLSTTIAR